ncbi:MAG: O-antigen ligase family protein [Acidobacteria bacterium]|nr:O-antigen ligase family protein [Acidobacteriota bacterium]
METGILSGLAGLVAAWLPVEVFPWAGVLLIVVLAIDVAAGKTWRSPAGLRKMVAPSLALGLWVVLGLTVGWDRATAASELGLAAVAAAVFWRASRRSPTARMLEAFSLGVSLLSLWALWQVTFGLRADLASVGLLPGNLQGMARQKILTGRAFAALAQPGHLAALLATIVPLAVSRITAGRRRAFWMVLAGSCFFGIALTRSLLGAGLAIVGLVLGWTARRGVVWKVALAGALGCLVVVAALRTDVTRLEPVKQRIENWKAAAWVWGEAPVMGVGLGGFGQAALAYGGKTANHPQHAHCLPLEWGAEMGLAGAGLAFLLFFWVVRLATRCWRIDRGLAGAVLIVPLHNLFDFSLFGWGVAIPWVVLAGWALATARGEEGREERSAKAWVRAFAIGGLTSMALIAFLNAAGASLERQAARARSPRTALVLAERSRTVAPWRFAPVQTIGRAAGDDPALVDSAMRDLEAARWWRPHSPALAMRLAMLKLAAHDTPGAMEEAARAAAEAPPRSGLEAAAKSVLAGR